MHPATVSSFPCYEAPFVFCLHSSNVCIHSRKHMNNEHILEWDGSCTYKWHINFVIFNLLQNSHLFFISLY